MLTRRSAPALRSYLVEPDILHAPAVEELFTRSVALYVRVQQVARRS